jgi:hypothetical protein
LACLSINSAYPGRSTASKRPAWRREEGELLVWRGQNDAVQPANCAVYTHTPKCKLRERKTLRNPGSLG